METLGVALVLLLVITIITLVGHGIWAFLAFLFGGRSRASRDGNQQPCMYCGKRISAADEHCGWCGRNLWTAQAAELADLEALKRQLRRFRQSGALKPQVVDSLFPRIEAYRKRLLESAFGQPAAAPPQPAAAIPRQEVVAAEAVAEPASASPRPQIVPAKSPQRAAQPIVPPVKSRAVEPAPSAKGPLSTAESEAAAKPHVVQLVLPQPAASRPTRPHETAAAPIKPHPAPAKPAAKAAPLPPRTTLAQLLAGFMEERNIRWGELIGGLLIVGSSVALVLSLWDRLKEIHYFPLVIFVAVSSAVFGVGLYAHHRWKLQSTSRALMQIATLLVPLNFFFMAILGKEVTWDPVAVAIALAALGLFTWLVGLTGRVLVPDGQWFQVLGVLGSSAAVLLAARLVGPEMRDWQYLAAGSFPVACFAVAVGGYLRRFSAEEQLDAARAAALLGLLGSTVFALAAAIGLLIVQAGGLAATQRSLSVLAPLAAMPILFGGLTVMRGVARDAALAAWHTAGTAVALVGMLAALAALGLAWPCPVAMLAVAVFDGMALVFAAWHWRLPALHAGAIACASLAYLLGFHAIYSGLPLLPGAEDLGPRMLRLLVGSSSGTAMIGLFLLFGAISELFARRGHRQHGAMYAGGAGVMAALGLMLVTWYGWHRGGADALQATILYAVYGAGSLALVARWRRIELSYLGLALLTATPLWALWWHPLTQQIGPLWAAVLAAEGLLLALAAAILKRYGLSQKICNVGQVANLPETRQIGNLPHAGIGGTVAGLYRTASLHLADIVAPAALALGAWTAWHDRTAIAAAPSVMPIIAAISIAATYLLLAWDYRSPQRTWLGSTVLLAGLIHTLVFNYTALVAQPWCVALLAHASLAVAAAAALDHWAKRLARNGSGSVAVSAATQRVPGGQDARAPADEVADVFSRPLGHSALLSSALAVPAALLISWADTMSLAWCLFWLAAIWLAIAWRHRDAGLFAAHQVMLILATSVATTAWLQRQQWLESIPRDLFHLGNIQAYGLALGVLALAWVAARIGLRRHAVAQKLLNPGWPTVDQVLRHSLVWGQLAVAALPLLPGLGQELARAAGAAQTAPQVPLSASGYEGWPLLALMSVVMIVALWERWREAELISTLLLAATVPCLIARPFAADVAVASALRWGMAAGFLACSVAVWNRAHLRAWCQKARMQLEIGSGGPQIAQAVLLVTTALPVLTVTLSAAMLQFAGTPPGGPAADTFFARLGPSVSYLVPLALVLAGMVGYALRERSAGYAFCGGLVAELIVTLGYALAIVTDPSRHFAVAELVTLIQLATLTAAVWALGWLLSRQWVDVWREVPEEITSSSFSGRRHVGLTSTVLMNIQIALGTVGNVLLLVAALFGLALLPWDCQSWTAAAGRPLGWITLALVAAAGGYRLVQLGRRPNANIIGLLGMAVLGLLACTTCWVLPHWGYSGEWSYYWAYRTLMLSWAAYALFIVCATWWVASVRTLPQAQGPPQVLIRAAAVWVRAAGISAVLLGLKAALLHPLYEEFLWAAAAIALASGAGATMAVWRRQEGWAFSAALGVNLAASLVVWYVHRDAPHFDQWWLRLVQANVIASSAVAMVWLAARRRLYQLRQLRLRSSPLLALQTVLPVMGNLVLLMVPVVWLVLLPARLPGDAVRDIACLAQWPGWLGLLLTAFVAAWYLRQVFPDHLMHVVGGLMLAIGVLLSGCVVNLGGSAAAGQWLAYHTLTIAWAAGALLVLSIGWLGRNLRLPPQDEEVILGVPAHSRAVPAGQLVFRSVLVQDWVTFIGILAFAVAVIHSQEDPVGPWYSIGAILGVSLSAGLLALWLRLPAYVYLSGLSLNAAGTIGWMYWQQQPTLAEFAYLNALCLAVGSAVWTLVSPLHPQGVPHLTLDGRPTMTPLSRSGRGAGGEGRPLPFSHLAAVVAVGLLTAVAAVGVAADASGRHALHLDVHRIHWIALAATAAAVTICLWDRTARFVFPGLYLLGLTTVGMLLGECNLGAREFWWRGSSDLAGYVLGTAALGWLLPRLRPAWRLLRIADEPGRWPREWFMQLQTVLGALAAALSAWVAIDFAFDGVGAKVALFGLGGRPAGSTSALMLVGAAIVMASQAAGSWRSGWQVAAMGLGVLLSSSLGWSLLDATAGTPTGDAPWLHRSVNLMVAAAMMTLLSGFGLGAVLPQKSDWIAAGRRITPIVGGLALLLLAAVLVQEGLLFTAESGTPMASWAIVIVAVALAGLAAGCLGFALHQKKVTATFCRNGPEGASHKRWLSPFPEPRWDPLGLSDRGRTAYVYAAEVLLALVGVHLWLTVPWLFRLGILRMYWMPIVMAVAFCGAALGELCYRRKMPVLAEPLRHTAVLLPAAPAIGFWFMQSTTAATWFLGDASPAAWFLIGLFYAFMAVSKRSLALGALAIVTGNMGLWVLWQRCGLDFYDRPQLWLIPLALAVLAAEHLDRRRLSEPQRAAVRYLALSVIYVSSTTEFLRGIGESATLPLVLTVLCVLGVLAGILLQVRSFLYLGATFLVVVIVRMIAYAASQPGQIWVFWVSCIFLGAAIIALFAVFEKRRAEVLAAVERLKQWKP